MKFEDLGNKFWDVHISGDVPRELKEIVARTPQEAMRKALDQVVLALKFEARPAEKEKDQ